MVLMVFGGVRVRNKNRGRADHFQLADGDRAGAGDDEVGCRKAELHLVDKLVCLDPGITGKIQSAFFEHLRETLPAVFPVAVDMVDLALFGVPLHQIGRHPVNSGRAEASTDREDGEVIVQTEFFPGFLFADAGEGLADGVSDDLKVLSVGNTRFRFREGEKNRLRKRRKHFSRNAGESVLLMQKDRNPHLLRLSDDRPGNISAGADRDVRFKVLDDLFGAVAGERKPPCRLDVMGDVPRKKAPVKTGDLDMGNRVALLGDHRILHISGHGRKQKFRAGIDAGKFSRNGDRRIDMTAGSAACKKYSHGLSAIPFLIKYHAS